MRRSPRARDAQNWRPRSKAEEKIPFLRLKGGGGEDSPPRCETVQHRSKKSSRSLRASSRKNSGMMREPRCDDTTRVPQFFSEEHIQKILVALDRARQRCLNTAKEAHDLLEKLRACPHGGGDKQNPHSSAHSRRTPDSPSSAADYLARCSTAS